MKNKHKGWLVLAVVFLVGLVFVACDDGDACACREDWLSLLRWTVTIPPTVTEDGEEIVTCSRCGHSEKRIAYATDTPGLAFFEAWDHPLSVSRGTANDSVVVIPAFHKRSPVIRIDNEGFRDYMNMTSITIPDSVMWIGVNAFWNTGIWNNTPDNSVVYADKLVVGYKGTINSNLTFRTDTVGIGNNAFRDCTGLTSVTIPDSVTWIGVNAFQGCTSLTIVILGNSVSYIGCTFDGCTSLTSIFVDNNNPNLSSQDGVLYDKAKTFLVRAPGAINGSFIIPDSVTYRHTFTSPFR